MTYLNTLTLSKDRISKSYLESKSLEDIRKDLLELDLSKVTNQHLLNLNALLNPVSKQVTGIEFVTGIDTGDLEMDSDPHSYIANGIRVHNTCNIPFDYSFEDFKDLYLDVYNTGVIKGFTTYRAGTMASVLSAKEETPADEEEIVLDDIKLPNSLPATLKTLKAEGKKYYLTVILNEAQERPVALFAHTNHHEKSVTATDAVERLIEMAREKGIPEVHLSTTLSKMANDTNTTKICRVISLCLRHGVLVRNVVYVLEQVDCLVGSFVFHIRKYLSSFIKEGETVKGASCPECGHDKMVYKEGCSGCPNCGYSKCG